MYIYSRMCINASHKKWRNFPEENKNCQHFVEWQKKKKTIGPLTHLRKTGTAYTFFFFLYVQKARASSPGETDWKSSSS